MYSEDTLDFGDFFAMLKSISEHAERKRLCLGNCFVAAGAVDHNTRQFNNFANPTAVGFAFEIYRKVAHVSHRTTRQRIHALRLVRSDAKKCRPTRVSDRHLVSDTRRNVFGRLLTR